MTSPDQIQRLLAEVADKKGFPADSVGGAWEEAWEELLAVLYMELTIPERIAVVRHLLTLLNQWGQRDDT
jgi:hypothetical protein